MEPRVARRVLIVAGESSGDRHAARLVCALRERGAIEARGVAGPALEAAGVTAIAPSADLAVVGFTGVLARLPRILAVERRVLAEARRFRPEIAILVDSPGFNFRIGPRLARLGVPVFYYIAPQVWAWHAERARAMSRWVTRLGVVFPFEEELFRAAGVDAWFVGHPLIEDLAPEVDAATLRARLGVPAATRLVGLLPGSRRGEFQAHLPRMVAAGRILAASRDDVVAVLAVAPGLEALVPVELRAGRGPVRAVSGVTHAIQAHAECCAVASGTATLETALLGTPLVVVYRTGRVNWEIARRVVKLSHIGLPNIVAGEEVAPELLQDAFTPAALAERLGRWLDDAPARDATRARLAAVRSRLGGPGAARLAAERVWELLS